MNAQKHTPEPWRVASEKTRQHWTDIKTGENIVAQVQNIHDTDTEHANARLIAAAPDLLEALQGLVIASYGASPYVHANCHVDTHQNAANNALINATLTACAAIAKAERNTE